MINDHPYVIDNYHDGSAIIDKEGRNGVGKVQHSARTLRPLFFWFRIALIRDSQSTRTVMGAALE